MRFRLLAPLVQVCLWSMVVLVWLWPVLATAQAADERVKVEILVGTSAATASDADTGVSPFARVLVVLPIASWTCGSTSWDCAPRFHFRTDFGGTSGAVVEISDPATFRSIDFAGGISQRFSESFFLAIYCEAGAKTILGDETDAGALRWGGCGVRLDHYGRGWINAIVTGDQRLGPSRGGYRPAVAVQGSVALYQSNGQGMFPDGASVALVGTGIFGINSESWAPGAPSSSITAGITVGYGR